MSTAATVLAAGLLGGLVAGIIGGAWGRTPAGNTALIVPFSIGPAIVAAGWTWLALAGAVSERREVVVSAVSFGLAALLLALLIAFLPLFAVSSNAPPLAGLLALAIPLLAAAPVGNVLAARVGRPRPGRGWGAMPVVVALLVVFVLAPTGIAYAVAPLLLPVVLVAPLAPDVDRSGELFARIAGAVVLPILVIGGIFVGTSLLGAA